MTTLKQLFLLGAIGYISMFNVGCEKYLSEKPDQKLTIPSKLQDLQALIDDNLYINQRSSKAIEISADDYYLTDANWTGLNEFDKRTYIWDKSNLFLEGTNNDWGNAYSNVYTANVVLDNIDKINRVSGDQDNWDNVKGQALFLRAQAFLQTAFIWASAYDESTADADLGIPLKLDPDFNKVTTRATLKQTYNQIISDLKAAADLLPAQPVHFLRPSRPGAYALLARTYLSMRDYANTGIYANLSLQLKNTLKDYNTLNPNPATSFPFAPRFSNDSEIIYETNPIGTPALNLTMAKIDSTLFKLYNDDDLRKTILFRSNNDATYGFRGSYSGSGTLFSGIATNEVYLMRAESYARAANATAAMADLNKLLEKRFLVNTFVPLVANTPAEALAFILTERRKELIMRGLRWMDVKRLNKEGANILLKRIIAGQTYTLQPNDPKYALPIPEDVIRISGITQNP